MKFCQRCNKPLTDKTAQRIDNLRPTGAGTTVYICKIPCKGAPTQTAPSRHNRRPPSALTSHSPGGRAGHAAPAG